MTQAGWYPDPHDRTQIRYFDGQAWTEHQQPAAPAAEPTPPVEPAPTVDATPAPAPDPAPTTEWNPPAAPWTAPPAAPAPQWTAPLPVGDWSAPPAGPPGGAYPGGGYSGGGYPAPTGGGYPAPVMGGYPTTPPTPARSRRRPLIIIGVVVVLVLAGGGIAAWQLTKSSAPSLTYQGHRIANAAAVLNTADSALASTVAARHGTKAADSRCYFARPDSPAAGVKKSDIEDHLVCGPVLFVDGDPAREYLSYALTPGTGSGSSTTLNVANSPSSPTPAALPTATTLTRPDGASAPAGPGGLSVPAPPPAAANTLIAAALGSSQTLTSLPNSVMVSLSTGVKLESAGAISRYGTGDDARSAPTGQSLIAFDYQAVSGESGEADPSASLSVLVSGRAARAVPEIDNSDQFVIVAVPSGATALLQLKADGVTQTLSLPAGRPGAGNLTVLTRRNRDATINKTVKVPVTYSEGGTSVTDTWTTTVGVANLVYWPPAHPTDHPAKPGDAYLFVDLTYTDPQSSGGPYGFDTPLVSLKLPGGTSVPAKNLATGNLLYNVLEVPGSFTTGTLVLGGSEQQSGVTVRITTPQSIPITFAAG